jgi:hypothetical protein
VGGDGRKFGNMVRFRGYALVDKAAYDSVSQKAAQAVGVLVGGRKGTSACIFKGEGVDLPLDHGTGRRQFLWWYRWRTRWPTSRSALTCMTGSIRD